jgi:hypothetical protein
MPRSFLPFLVAAALLAAAPATAAAADTLVAPDPAAQQITALDGTLVWVSGKFGHQTLMQRTPDGTISAVEGAPASRNYRSLDLGRSRSNTLVLTYLRCDTGQGCTVNAGPSQWRNRIAYGLFCTGSAANRKRTGLYVKTDGSAPLRLGLPKDAVKFGIRTIESVDLRGTQVAAVAADIYEYSFSQTTSGRGLRSFLAAASEGDSDESARGLAIESASAWWTLTNASHAGDPNETIIHREVGSCAQIERLTSAPDAEFVASDLAVDGGTLYLLVPGSGIVSHAFAPEVRGVCP